MPDFKTVVILKLPMWDLLRLYPPVRYARPVTEHVSLRVKSLCKNMARASGGGANIVRPLSSRGAQTEKIPNVFVLSKVPYLC